MSPSNAREELNALLDAAIGIAFNLIKKYGNHIPFALVVRTNGEQLNLAADNSEIHDGAILKQTLLQEVREMVARAELKAVAFAHNIEYKSAIDRSHVDAIEVDRDHLEDEPVTCILPYKLGSDMQPQPGELFAIDSRERFFVRPAC
jgi:hypothetical protein